LYASGYSGSVILDARTGGDEADDNNGITPDIVVPGYGLERDDASKDMKVYRATG